MSEEKKKSKSKMPLIIGILAVVVIALGIAVFAMSNSGDKKVVEAEEEVTINPLTGEVVEGELAARPILVSNDNADGARPQSGISKADIVYEFPAEGYIPRLLPVYYSEIPDTVAAVRSARPYLVEMAMEYSGIFVGYGVSPQALTILQSGEVLYVNPMADSSDEDMYWRGDDRVSPHNVYTNLQEIATMDKVDGWQDVQELRTFPWYNTDPTEEEAVEIETFLSDFDSANRIYLGYTSESVEYQYDITTNLYTRWVDGVIATDYEDGTEITTSNVIIQYVDIGMYDEKRLSIDLTQGGDCIVFTQGKVFVGKWSKEDDYAPTIYYMETVNKDGEVEQEEITLSVGKTWIQMLGTDYTATYEQIEQETTEE